MAARVKQAKLNSQNGPPRVSLHEPARIIWGHREVISLQTSTHSESTVPA